MRVVPWLTAVWFAVAALPIQAVELRWNPGLVGGLTYRAIGDADITGRLGTLEPERWLKDPAAFEAVIEELRRLALPEVYWNYRMNLMPVRDGKAIRARLVGIPPRFAGKPITEQEAELRERAMALGNAIMLQGDVDLAGDSTELTFYRAQKEKNVLMEFFYLPKRNVSVGDYWQLPVKFIDLGPGFFVLNSSTHNRVTLKALKKTPDGTVAELEYLVVERASGYVERVEKSGKGRPEFAVTISCFGFGEFLIEQGYWLRQRLVTDYAADSENKVVRKRSLSALEVEK